MASDGAFSADDIGAFTAAEHDFLESTPACEEEENEELFGPPGRELRTPSPHHRRRAMLLFISIAGFASFILTMALLRLLREALFS